MLPNLKLCPPLPHPQTTQQLQFLVLPSWVSYLCFWLPGHFPVL